MSKTNEIKPYDVNASFKVKCAWYDDVMEKRAAMRRELAALDAMFDAAQEQDHEQEKKAR